MIVTVIRKENMISVSLPEKIKGQFWLYDSHCWNAEKIAGIEGIGNEWVLKSNKKYQVVNDKNEVLKNTILLPSSIYVLKNEQESVYVYTEPVTVDRQIFNKYLFKGDITLNIGRSEKNDIVILNKFTSSEHAVLSCTNGDWTIQDCGSTNGTFINEKRCSRNDLSIGDVVFIMGIKIIVGKNFFAINNPDDCVRINSAHIQKFVSQQAQAVDDDPEPIENVDYFSRVPRFKRDIKETTIKIDTPPQSPLSQEMPWLLVMGSSIAMGMMSAVTLISAIASFNVSSMIMGGSMLLGTVLLPTISKRYEKKSQKKKEELRQRKYREYLNQISLKINEECQRQEEILRENYADIVTCTSLIQTTSQKLWEREPGQNDFLSVRVGIGEGELKANLQYPEKKFILDEDNLQEELYSLCKSPRKLQKVPVTLSLYDNYISGVIGDEKLTTSVAYNIIIQLSTYYSFDEVKFVFLYDDEDKDRLDFVRWLPHVWNDDKSFRYIATNYDEVKSLSAYLEKDVEYRISKNESDRDEISPYFVVFSFSNHLSRNAEFLRRIYDDKSNLKFSVINFRKEFKKLPKECSIVVELHTDEEGHIFEKNGSGNEGVLFKPDKVFNFSGLDLSKHLANIYLDSESQKYSLPKMITFLDMYGVGKIEHLNPLTRWSENDPTKSLQAAVGVDTTGHLFSLDLHEKFHGPHGLIAGMTGSGKSEFIITYILSMAVNYHPDEVAFILIDYKGGGLAGAFVDEQTGMKLPHVAGTITNLDGASITRSLISIQSELRRRQGIFNEARKVSNEGTIDIYKYQKLYRKGLVKEPLPHLFIISDEFAELKTQQPEFMEQLISAARIGRSLGVHLILATQKPSGVVDDQIWSNSRFRVCLKVQEKADSMDMIKRPDAASLADTGRFYLQVGFNEFFDMGQSAWCGAPYVASDRVKTKYDNSVRFVDNLGQTLAEVKPKEKNVTGNEPKQIVALVKYLSDIAEEENIHVRKLWLDPIPEKIFVDDIAEKYAVRSQQYYLNPVIGEYDDPFNQSQSVFTLPISDEGHAIIYGSTGSGTETLLETLTYSLISNHSADEVNIYILDFGSETLGAFKKAPQVGDVLFSSDEEKVINLFKMLQKEVERRKKLFSDFGGNYQSYIEKCEEKPSNIVVLINNFAVFAELYDQQEDDLASIARESQKYGIYFVLTSTSGNAVRYRLQQNFKQLIVLQMNDPSDYVGILGQTDGVCPSKLYGRGIVKYDRVYEFQTALAADTNDIMEYYRSISDELSKKSIVRAKKVPILPDVVDWEFISPEVSDLRNVPVGVNKHNLTVNKVDFDSRLMSSILSDDISQNYNFTASLCKVLSGMGYGITVIDGTDQMRNCPYLAEENDIMQTVVELFDDLVLRNNTYKDNLSDPDSLSDFSERFVFLVGLKYIFDQLDDDAADKLKVLLDKAELAYKIRFVIVDEISSVSAYSFQTWYKHQVSAGDGIWIGNGLYDQYVLKLGRNSGNEGEIDQSFGYVVSKGKETLVKLINFVETEAEDDE